MATRHHTELREVLDSAPEMGPWVSKLVRKSIRQGSELVIIFTSPDAFRLHIITVSGRVPAEADIDLMAFHCMTKVVLDETRKPLTYDHQVVAATAPTEILATLGGMNFGKAPLWNAIPSRTGQLI